MKMIKSKCELKAKRKSELLTNGTNFHVPLVDAGQLMVAKKLKRFS